MLHWVLAVFCICPVPDGAYNLQVHGFELPKRVFPCATPDEVRATLPEGEDVVAFQCRNPIHRAHYELFTRALKADNVSDNAVCLVHPTCGPTQGDDIPGIVRCRSAPLSLLRLCCILLESRRVRLQVLPNALKSGMYACC
jgi:ATP sulfurylase